MKAKELDCEKVYDPELVAVLEENIRTILKVRQEALGKRSFEQRISDKITETVGHISFLYVHIVLILVYILINTGILGIKPFDPYPFPLLIGIITIEVLFITTFILISQNREKELADQRADLDLQMSLLNQNELSQVLKMLDAIQDKLGIPNDEDFELRKMEERILPTDVLIEMELVQQRAKTEQRQKKSKG
jgi:uncharacterized membrane protein